MSATLILFILWILLIAIWWIFVLIVKIYEKEKYISRKKERYISIFISSFSIIGILYGIVMEVKFFVIFAHLLLIILDIGIFIKGIKRSNGDEEKK